ncbi:hypothetical protein TNCV_1897881 [Trichonephila clavipes]|uniref:Uncharacterized protein n=1 Tax=Trichonephila clavipes TaxID=2585209 RepID=A0A8X6WFP1_TRICX|nr:hypothetical protein TNCV_1897881 [Trichonephila clavipes]
MRAKDYCAHLSIRDLGTEVQEQMFRSGGQSDAKPPVFSPQASLEERWETPDYPLGVLPHNWNGTEQNHTVTIMVLKAKANDRRKILALSRDEFRGPRSDVTVDQMA